ncbi:MAG: FG-GAP-like repeat-containing protein [Thermoplasmatota archaeon]
MSGRVPLVLLAGLLLAHPVIGSNLLSHPATGIDGGPTRAGPVTFTNISAEAGLAGAGGNYFSWGDLDNDGYQDLLVDGKRLYRNSGPPGYTFTDVTAHSGIDAQVNSGVWGDYDNDGWLDIFCGGGRGSNDHPLYPDILWHNERDGTFSRVTSGAPSDTFPTVAAGWADMDRDGFIDIYMANYENSSLVGYPDHFWINDGSGGFVNATVSSGMSEEDHPYQGRGVSWADFDMDGFMDCYVSNYRIMRNYLYRNLGNGTMEEAARELGVEGHGNDHPVTREGPYYGHSVGSSWGDLDNDGDLDLWVTNLAHKDPWRGPICDDSYLFENLGPENGWSFTDRREGSGIPIKQIPGAVGGGDELMVSCSMADYDNDGDLDLFLPQIYNISYGYSYMYRNDGGFTFTDVSSETGIRVWNTYGSAWCDYNDDGWPDLVTGGGRWDEDLQKVTDYGIRLYRNDGGKENGGSQWLKVQLEGRESNSAAIGARVDLEVDPDGDGIYDNLIVREVQGGTAAHGQQDSMILHFGLGDDVKGIRATVHWPMGRKTVHDDLVPGTLNRFFEPTEDIEIVLSFIGLEADPSGSRMELSINNPSVYPIDFMELITVVDIHGEVEEVVEVMDGPIETGTTSVLLSLPGIGNEERANISYSISRSYPPVSGTVSGSYLYDPMTNKPPVPLMDGPTEGSVGERLDFSGERSYDPDGQVVSYMFDMGDGTVYGWIPEPFVSHVYGEESTYSVHLKVRDDEGETSVGEAVIDVFIEGEIDRPPRAEIIEISPVEAVVGEDIMFEGEGTAYGGTYIDAYEWSSSIDGILSTRRSFRTDELSPGAHDISFRVMDSGSRWSDPEMDEVTVVEEVEETLWIAIDPIDGNGTFAGIVTFTGTSGPPLKVDRVEVRIDSGFWDEVWSSPDWSYRIDCTELTEGIHRLDARSYGDGYYSTEYASLEFKVVSEDEDIEEPPPEQSEEFLSSELLVYIGIPLSVLLPVILFTAVMFIRRRPSASERVMAVEVLQEN